MAAQRTPGPVVGAALAAVYGRRLCENSDASDEKELGQALISSVNPSFTVHDQTLNQVAQGVVGRESILLSPGSYELRTGEQTHTLVIQSEQETEIHLD